jgi:hypothetical protein
VAALQPVGPVLREVVQSDHVVLVGQLGLLRGAEAVRALLVLGPLVGLEQRALLLQLGLLRTVGQVVGAEDHVLRRRGERLPVRRRQDVVRGQHEDAGLRLRLC